MHCIFSDLKVGVKFQGVTFKGALKRHLKYYLRLVIKKRFNYHDWLERRLFLELTTAGKARIAGLITKLQNDRTPGLSTDNIRDLGGRWREYTANIFHKLHQSLFLTAFFIQFYLFVFLFFKHFWIYSIQS